MYDSKCSLADLPLENVVAYGTAFDLWGAAVVLFFDHFILNCIVIGAHV